MIQTVKRTAAKHEKLVERIATIVACLYQGALIDKQWIMERFHVTERTAYRDLDRLSNILEENMRGGYQLAKDLQPQMHVSELQSFATYTNVSKIFPNTTGTALRFETKNSDNTCIHGYTSRDNSVLSDTINKIKTAINERLKINFRYSDKKREVEPYKLINHNGLWYLAGVDDGNLKSFEIGKIENISKTVSSFEINKATQTLVENSSGISFGVKNIVTLNVSSKVAAYVLRRPLFPEQEIISKNADGSVVITTACIQSDHLFRWVRYWLPDITITSPDYLAKQFIDDFSARVTSMKDMC
ncbi:WYL domain-containing protein [Aeromonas veronii]|nr:WYL domain-containing protein [Aeromonas veronii]